MLAKGARFRQLASRSKLFVSNKVATEATSFEAQPLRHLSTVTETIQKSSNLSFYGISGAIAGLAAVVAYDFYSIQPANSRLHLTKLPAEHHPFEIGEFKCIDDRGKPFTANNVKNEFAVFLFGSLEHPEVHYWIDRFAQALWRSDDLCNQEHLKPVFFSLDEKNDTPEKCKAMKDSLKSNRIHKECFHRRVAIVTGEDTAKIHEAAHHFTRKFFNKNPSNTGTPESSDLGDIYLVSPEGKFLESYTLEADPKLIAEDWAKVQNAWNIHHPSWHGCRNIHQRYA